MAAFWRRPYSALRRVEALSQVRHSKEFEALAVLFKRVKNITKGFDGQMTPEIASRLIEPAERGLLQEIDSRWPAIETALARADFAGAVRHLVTFTGPVDRFFVDVLVMSEDPALKEARLTLLTTLRRAILNIADIAEVAPEEGRPS